MKEIGMIFVWTRQEKINQWQWSKNCLWQKGIDADVYPKSKNRMRYRNDAVVSSKSVFRWKLGRCRKKFPILRFQNCEVKFLFIRFFLFFRLQVQAVKGKINKQNTTKDSPKLQVWRKCAGCSGQSVFLLLREWRTAVTSGWELEFPPCYLRWKNSCWKACNKQILRHFSQILLWFDRFCDVFRNSSYRQRKVLQIQHFILNRSQ